MLRLKELLGVGWSESGVEVLKKGHLVLLLNLVQRNSVEHWLDETTVGGETNDSENKLCKYIFRQKLRRFTCMV